MQSSQPTIGVLVPVHPGPVAPPHLRPIGRGALRIVRGGGEVVFGDRLRGDSLLGHRLTLKGWESGQFRVDALYDRFPSQSRPREFSAILKAQGALPMGNPLSFTELLRDKLDFQALMESTGIVMPEVVSDPLAFEDALDAFGRGFLKPRYGGRGRGISLVTPGDRLPAWGEGAVPGVEEPLFLQRAIDPPEGWAGVSVRVLLQREPEEEGRWIVVSNVVRRSRTDPVINVHRGAEAAPAATVLSPFLCLQLEDAAQAVAEALGGVADIDLATEMGVDLVLNAQNIPVLIEANSRPRGRLEALAIAYPEAYALPHIEACARPLRYLSWWVERGL